MDQEIFVVNNLPKPLTAEETEYYLLKKEQNVAAARDELILHNIFLVIYLINKEFKDEPYDEKDLLQIGLMGLMRGIDNYKTNLKVNFNTFIYQNILTEINTYIEKNTNINISSLDQIVEIDEDGEEIQLIETLSDNYTEDLTYNYIQDEESRIVKKIVTNLPKKDRYIIESYFGFNKKKLTQEEIAKSLNVSKSLISRRVRFLLDKIKIMLQANRINLADYNVKKR